MTIKGHKYMDIIFVEDSPVIYDGPSYVHQFGIGEINSFIESIDGKARYIFTMPMGRHFTNQLLTTFIPTVILWLLAYSTLFINIEHSSDRLMVTVTTLLVLAALLSAFTQDLPKTSYIKYVDIWFAWHITNIFGLIIYHIALDSKAHVTEIGQVDMVRLFNTNDSSEDEHKSRKNGRMSKAGINKIGIILTPAVNAVFYFVYFYYTI